MATIQEAVGFVAHIIGEEYIRSRKTIPVFNSTHEGYAVLLEEVDELWEAVKSNDAENLKEEAIQVAAMAFAILIELTDLDHD